MKHLKFVNERNFCFSVLNFVYSRKVSNKFGVLVVIFNSICPIRYAV